MSLSKNANTVLLNSTQIPAEPGFLGIGGKKAQIINLCSVETSGLSQADYDAAVAELRNKGYLPNQGGRRKTRRNKKTRKTRAQKKRSSK